MHSRCQINTCTIVIHGRNSFTHTEIKKATMTSEFYEDQFRPNTEEQTYCQLTTENNPPLWSQQPQPAVRHQLRFCVLLSICLNGQLQAAKTPGQTKEHRLKKSFPKWYYTPDKRHKCHSSFTLLLINTERSSYNIDTKPKQKFCFSTLQTSIQPAGQHRQSNGKDNLETNMFCTITP
jgi:hypothetical protein